MNINEITNKIKGFIKDRLDSFKKLSKLKKIAVIIAIIALILAIIFGVKYINDSKYDVLFSGLDTNDAAIITKELENKKIDMKIEGDSIYVPKDEVDKLRLELSGNISNGSKGFEIMDEGSSFGLTDEEFKIKKQRMLQGEIEKTIKSFEQVESARVHIINGEESVFAKESEPGSAAVSLNIKPGNVLDPNQIRAIISLVSASAKNIPKQNIDVLDQNMNLLSEGLFDENGNIQSSNSSGIYIARKAEKDLNIDLEKSVSALLEPMFGKGKVLVKVNSDLNFDTNETTDIKIDPERVAVKEHRTENKTTNNESTGGAIDNNMNNVGGSQKDLSESKEEDIDYEIGRTESKTIKAQGEINRITVSVAIDGQLSRKQITQVEETVSNAIGFNNERGDSVSVVSMKFGNLAKEDESLAAKEEMNRIMKTVAYIVGALLLSIFAILIYLYINKKKKESSNNEQAFDDSEHLDIINQKIQEMENARASEGEGEVSMSLEEEVRLFASENQDQVTDLIKSWLSE